ncbi:hypothetical protein [Pseudomonas sp. CFBP13528]|uniref:hypothetical protein n=1 Tax=Pseudomonas sp. CFBP13528 TaxID=2184006 RepID=UPI0010BF8AC1|nr:hypothetical protein [Pseudomonas sp. CFBP13528]
MDVKATVIVWLPEYEDVAAILHRQQAMSGSKIVARGEGASSVTLRQLRVYEIDSQALNREDLDWGLAAPFFSQWSFATIRAIKQHTVFISLKPCQKNWQKKDPAKEPGQKP